MLATLPKLRVLALTNPNNYQINHLKDKKIADHAGCTENDTPKLANSRELPQFHYLSSNLEPLDSFKYAKIKSRIRLDVDTDHPKFLN